MTDPTRSPTASRPRPTLLHLPTPTTGPHTANQPEIDMIRLYIVASMGGNQPIPGCGESVQISTSCTVTWFADTVAVRQLTDLADAAPGISWVCAVDFESSYEIATNMNKSSPIFAQFLFARLDGPKNETGEPT